MMSSTQLVKRQVGRPVREGIELHRLPVVVCWNCRKPVAWGEYGPGEPDKPRVVKCNRHMCGAWNELG